MNKFKSWINSDKTTGGDAIYCKGL